MKKYVTDAFSAQNDDKLKYFAVIKDYNTHQYVLLAKCIFTGPYYFICQDKCIVKYKTPTSARNAAKAIAHKGLKDAGYELGDEYKIRKNNRKKTR